MADKMGNTDTTVMLGGRANYGKGSSGEGALDYSPGDNEDSEGGSSGSGWRGGNPQRSQGSTGMRRSRATPDTVNADPPSGSTPFTAVQAPNRPK